MVRVEPAGYEVVPGQSRITRGGVQEVNVRAAVTIFIIVAELEVQFVEGTVVAFSGAKRRVGRLEEIGNSISQSSRDCECNITREVCRPASCDSDLTREGLIRQ